VQAVRLVEPFLWRPLGWCRVEVDVAGRQRRKGEGEAQRGQLRTLIPVGKRSLGVELVDRLLPDRPHELSPPPRRVFWKSPLRYRALSWGRTETCVATTSGRLRRVTCWVPLEKAQSLRHVQGPVQRRLRLASVHVDTAGRAVHATLRDRDAVEATRALAELTDLARVARRRPTIA
jgi:putative membrane protein